MSQALSPILFRYIGRRYFVSFMAIYGGLLGIIYTLDSIEIMRRLAKYSNFNLRLMVEITALKLPEIGLEIMPFATLIAAVFTFWRLTRTSELVIVRATGVSAWQFLLAPMLIAVGMACIKMMVLNPVSAVMIAHYEQMEARYMSISSSTVNVAKTGLWLRQKMDEEHIAIIHADTVKLPEWLLTPATGFFFNNENVLTHRIDSAKAELKSGEWIFFDAWVNPIQSTPDQTEPKHYNELRLPTSLTISDIETHFASPRTVPFWYLPDYAQIMRDTGFESNPLWAHFYGLLAEPVLNMALIFLAAALALRSPRTQRGWWLVCGTVAVGFIVFFIGDFLQALGISERLPLVVAAFAPATISLLMGLTALLYLEDG